ncbi:hypothetical protein DFA_01201 [Cavenderia fasciculata]|uniref:Transmembrane protein n=1 Tax=Cavenderia fasciculata TaxID=261658 RepID=F4PRI0_CACFS|nr:uncharacterized protein DFA_01201 [Cavenderia fasciculata]EGG21320.1 hypothetical protein DFA_01201 [Cavenderia fasciculata]|eukprot:XP_004359170.1 hypothetical protein DFA_01201 [Cavenderia fasciculata]
MKSCSCFIISAAFMLLVITFSLCISLSDGYAKINPSFQVYSERRSTRFFGNMTLTSGESDVLLNVLYSYPTSINWMLLKDGFNVYEGNRIVTTLNTTTLSCVTTHDSGVYSLVQHDSLNTGFNVQTSQFNLTVVGDDKNEEGLSFVTPPSTNALNGQSFPIQPVLRFVNGAGVVEPFIVKSPESNNAISKKSGVPNNIITYTSASVIQEHNLIIFTGLAIVGEPGEYIIGFVTTAGCSVLIYPEPINVGPEWSAMVIVIAVSLLFSFAMIFITAGVKLFIGYRRTGRISISTFLHSVQAPIDEVLGKNIALSTYFKVLRLFLLQSLLFTIISLTPYLPITKTGDNKLTGAYALSQANWFVDSSYLFSYSILSFLVFVSLVVIYTRFNDERIYHNHDSNHLVTSRSVMLTGLPKSLVDCNILKNYLQTSYSKGIYSVTIVLEKHFSEIEHNLDLDGKIDSIFLSSGLSSSNNEKDKEKEKEQQLEQQQKDDHLSNENSINISINDQGVNINNDNLEPLKSTGTAFITFSCVSDAHLFKTQFSPYKWTWVKDVYPMAPQQFQIELQMKRWKSYNIASVSDLLWTKLHNPSRLYGPALTTFLLILSIFFFSCLSFLSVLIYDSQFEKFKSHSFFHYKRRNGNDVTLAVYSFWFYIFLPCCILLVVNRLIPPCISSIFKKSWITVRSSLKSRTMAVTFYAQVFSIAVVPSFYFMMMMGTLSGRNVFYTPIDFFRTGGLFYVYFIIFFSIVSPILDSYCIASIVFKVIRCRKVSMDDVNGKCLDLANQYCNFLLTVLLISIYAPFYPLLFVLLFFYLTKKYYFDKYIVVASSLPPPPSDKLLIEPLQNCIWFTITLAPAVHLLYCIGIYRTDMMFIFVFLLVVGFGRYVPSCSKSLCYSVCDGAILPCVDNPNRIDDEDEYIDMDNEMMDFGNNSSNSDQPPQSQQMSHPSQQPHHRRRTNNHASEQDININNNNLNNSSGGGGGGVGAISNGQTEKEMKEINDKETILNIEQQYSTRGSQGRFSFLYRFRLPRPKSITITQYSSPFFNTSHSQCIIHDEAGEYNPPSDTNTHEDD